MKDFKKMQDGSSPSLKLRRITEQDLEMIMYWRMSPEVTKYMYTDPVLTLEGQKKWFEQISSDVTVAYWVMNCNGVDIGLLNLADIDKFNSRASWGIYIADTSFRGLGLARTFLLNLYDYAFSTLDVNKLCCTVFSCNNKAIAVYKNCGAEVEDILKKHIKKNDEFFDIVVMGITKNRWEHYKKTAEYWKAEIDPPVYTT